MHEFWKFPINKTTWTNKQPSYCACSDPCIGMLDAKEALLANTPTQTKSLLHSLEQATRDIGFYMNSDKTEPMYQDGVTSLLHGKPLKSVDQFIYLGSNISSTESEVKTHIGKIWTTTDR